MNALDPALLDLASGVESVGIGLPWTPQGLLVAEDLHVAVLDPHGTVPGEALLQLHEAMATRLLADLDFKVTELHGPTPGVRLEPALRAEGTIIGLHGQFDRGARFASVFAELLATRPLRVLCPDSFAMSPDELDVEPVLELLEADVTGPVWIVGLSAGAILGLRARPRLAGRVLGVVAIAGSPRLGGLDSAGVPTLYIHGTHDCVFPLAQVESEIRQESGAELVRVEGWGHAFPYRLVAGRAWPWMEQLAATASDLG